MIKKIVYILISFIIFSLPVQAEMPSGHIECNIYGYNFKPSDKKVFLKKADNNFKLYMTTSTEPEKKFYLQEAMRYYYLVTLIDNKSINAHIGLGKIYDIMNLDKYSQEHFYKAYNVNKDNAELNQSFGDYYYKRDSFIRALKHYKIAYANGYSNSLYLNKKIAICYEKLADLENSRFYYINAYKLDSENEEIINKIKTIDKLDYTNSQYYLFKK